MAALSPMLITAAAEELLYRLFYHRGAALVAILSPLFTTSATEELLQWLLYHLLLTPAAKSSGYPPPI